MDVSELKSPYYTDKTETVLKQSDGTTLHPSAGLNFTEMGLIAVVFGHSRKTTSINTVRPGG